MRRYVEHGISFSEYKKDMATFFRVVKRLNEKGPDERLHVMWHEVLLEHEQKKAIKAAASSSSPCGAPRAFGIEGADPTSLEALSPAALDYVCPKATSLEDLVKPPCHGRVAGWRDTVAATVARREGVPLMPLAAALKARPDMHEVDCMHWCDNSEATLHMAMAALSSVRAAIEEKWDS